MLFCLIIITILSSLYLVSRQSAKLKKEVTGLSKKLIIPSFIIILGILIGTSPTALQRDQEWFNGKIKVPARLLDQSKWMQPYHAIKFDPKKADENGTQIYHGSFGFDRLLVVAHDGRQSYGYDTKTKILSPPNMFLLKIPYFTANIQRFITISKDLKSGHIGRTNEQLYVDDYFKAIITKDKTIIQMYPEKDLKKPFYYKIFQGTIEYKELIKKYDLTIFPKNMRYQSTSLHSNSGKLYRIPYSSNEKMVEISYRELQAILDPNWSYQNLNLSHKIGENLRKEKDSQKIFSKLLFISPAAYFKLKEVVIFIFLFSIFIILFKRQYSLAFILASPALILTLFSSDLRANKSSSNKLVEAFKENNHIESLRSIIKMQNSRFFARKNRQCYQSLFSTTTDVLQKEELTLAHNLSLSDKASLESLPWKASKHYVEHNFFVGRKKVCFYIPYEREFSYSHHQTYILKDILKAKIKNGETATKFIVDMRRLYIQVLKKKKDDEQSFGDYMKEEFQKLDKYLSTHPEKAFMKGIR